MANKQQGGFAGAKKTLINYYDRARQFAANNPLAMAARGGKRVAIKRTNAKVSDYGKNQRKKAAESFKKSPSKSGPKK